MLCFWYDVVEHGCWRSEMHGYLLIPWKHALFGFCSASWVLTRAHPCSIIHHGPRSRTSPATVGTKSPLETFLPQFHILRFQIALICRPSDLVHSFVHGLHFSSLNPWSPTRSRYILPRSRSRGFSLQPSQPSQHGVLLRLHINLLSSAAL